VTLEVDIDNISIRSPHQRPPSADTATTESSETASPQRWLIRHDPRGDVEAGNIKTKEAASVAKVASNNLQNGNAGSARERSTTYEEDDDDDPWNKVVVLEDNSPAWASEFISGNFNLNELEDRVQLPSLSVVTSQLLPANNFINTHWSAGP
jgi:hypothetical protein